MIEITVFEQADQEEVIRLVLHCQNDGSRPTVGVEHQPELRRIRETFLADGGCFWVAKENGRVAGSIGLMNGGEGVGILKKFFVYEEFRGSPHHLGQRLYAQLLSFAQEHGFRKLILDTPRNTGRAHRFYEKAGFVKLREEDLPVRYSCPYQNCDYFLLEVQPGEG